MLKWFSGGSSSRSRSSHVGKVFHVNEYRVIVEDVIAEGMGCYCGGCDC